MNEKPSIDFIVDALQLIKKERSNVGAITCPKCGATLNYSRSSFISEFSGETKQHVWGKCVTTGCLKWAM